MRLLALSICLLAIVITTRALTIANTIARNEMNGTKLECLQNADLSEDELITHDEIKNDNYGQNTERAKKNGCFSACILQKRGIIIGTEIQKDKLYAKEAHAHVHLDIQTAIYRTVDRCVEEAKTNPDLCDKSLSLVVCLLKPFI